MSTSLSSVNISPRVREVFDIECLAILKTRVQRPMLAREPQELLPRFAGYYRNLCALPRRTRRSIERHWKRSLSAIALLMTLAQVPAMAATIPVAANTPPAINSDAQCSLIEAIVNANNDAATYSDCVAGSGTDTIVLPAGSMQKIDTEYSHNSNYQSFGLPGITSRIVIEGRQSKIGKDLPDPPNYDDSSRVTIFTITSSGDLTLNETIVSGGAAHNGTGGGIKNIGGKLTLIKSTVSKNLANYYGGGGVYTSGGTVTLTNSQIVGNNSSYCGGIDNRNMGTVTLINSIVSDNGATDNGGGICNRDGSTITLKNSTVSNNRARNGWGGGISNGGTLILIGSRVLNNFAYIGGGISSGGVDGSTITNSTISGNTSSNVYDTWGAGVYNSGTLTITNSTISNNSADADSVYSARGGGVYNIGTLTLNNVTVTGNTANSGAAASSANYGGGGGLYSGAGTMTLSRTLVSGNTAAIGPEVRVMSSGATVAANNHNLFGHDSTAGTVGFTPGPLDIVPNVGVSDILLPLADNGGLGFTHALAIGSPAIDASPLDADCPATDQRGNPRPRGAACDIGAFEGSAVLCNGLVTTMVGTEKSDVLTGTPGPDVISGLGSNDVIRGLGGDDVICGGGGNDRLYGGAGNDQLLGEAGNDRLFGQGNDDTLDGGNGTDQCDGGGNSPAGDTANACEKLSHVP